MKWRTLMLFAGVEEHCHDVLRSEDVLSDDKVDKNGDAHETAVETTDGDDDNDEFVEWNEGDGNVTVSYTHLTLPTKRIV